MREIKFRAWDTEVGQDGPINTMWYEDDVCAHEDTWNIGHFPGNAIMQYTGLHDKNGKEIYEGDIVLTPGGQRLGVDIEYAMLGDPKFWSITPSECAVIGNIYENGNLLEDSHAKD
jgi:hypothetical protein